MHALPLLASAIAIIGNAVPIDDWKDNQEYARMVKGENTMLIIGRSSYDGPIFTRGLQMKGSTFFIK